MSRKRMMMIVGAMISLIFLYLAFQGQDWNEIAKAFGQADYRWLLPAGALILTDYLFRAWRWGMILKPAARRALPMSILFPVLLLGFAANNVFPARAGELWRMWGLSHRTELRKTIAFSTLIVERVFDGLTLIFFLALAGAVYPISGETKLIEYGMTALFVGVLIGLLLFLFLEDWTLRIAARLMWPVPDTLQERLLGVMERFAKGLHALRQPRALLGIIGSSLLAWGCQALSFTMILLAFGYGESLSGAELFGISILMLTLINLLIMIPAGPGNVGTFEAAGLLALTIAGIAIAREKAIAIVIVTHILQWLLVTALGVLLATREGITLARLGKGPELSEG